ncbi:conserved hypothetical protein [Candida dubliniensis CD36]|uniref:Uncharacterized protein n=1 Tax=Candida dubliniensis (strain CD36 / ATCC MYA-646 / CBS 7987 / NCPF 3949 / NRRL Y-17841) TaxID=573826 RepID=B9W9C6_CANDC|nr:conserved hypothetical protein [Candida dubliniensis CD36]CAX45408.1 conserved hypothetical protein [Candida dubliniensis CD36]
MFRVTPRATLPWLKVLSQAHVLSPVRTFKLPSIFSAVKRANEIDEKFTNLAERPIDYKVGEIIKQVDKEPELLFQLGFFFYECKRIGITQDLINNRKRGVLYWPIFFGNLIPLNRAFWDTMHLMNKAQHSHRLNPFKINEIGLLDPKNFPSDFYKQLLTGKYNGIDFRDTKVFSMSRPQWEESKDTV